MAEKIVVKVGSNVLTTAEGYPNEALMQQLIEQLVRLQAEGVQVVLVSSGAVAAGRSLQTTLKTKSPVEERQVLAAIGQVALLQRYQAMLAAQNAQCAQVLVTKQDFKDRQHYLNMRNCLNALLENRVLPVVNENDTVAITELMFTDNDELAGLVAAMLNADRLIILSNIEGVYDRDPSDDNASILKEIREGEVNFASIVGSQRSSFGRGGMITKCHNALKIAQLGIPVYIANGFSPSILLEIMLDNANPGTYFPAASKASNIKTWVATSGGYSKASVWINEGAQRALFSERATSLLPVGIIRLEGDFRKGDLLKILNQQDEELGVGVARYGKKAAENKLGKSKEPPLIHYDYLRLYHRTV